MGHGLMHVADVWKGNLGLTATVCVGTVTALVEKLTGSNNVVICFYGDGANSAGHFANKTVCRAENSLKKPIFMFTSEERIC